MPARVRNVSPLPHTIGGRCGRAASADQPSPRPTSRPRHRSLSPSGRSIITAQPLFLGRISGPRRRSTSPPAGVSIRPRQRLLTRSQGALVPRGEAPAAQTHYPRPSADVPTLSEDLASARARSNRVEGGATGSQLVLGPQVGNWLGGSHGLPSTSQRAGRGSPRRQSPSPMEVEKEHVFISSHGTPSPHDARVTGSVGRSRRRGSTPIRARRDRGGEDGRASGRLFHTPPLTRGTVPGSQKARRAAASFV